MTSPDDTIREVGELFRLLGNETRMRIMWALWSEFDFAAYVTEDRDGLPFAALLDATDVDDSGNFNYHLGRLTGTLVTGGDDGYVLTPLGYNVMRSIERYATFEYATIDERTLADPCPFCGGDLVGEYRRGVVSVRCRDCRGLEGDGNFTFVELAAPGVSGLSLPQLLDAATLSMFSKVGSSSHGVCWHCRASMDRSFELCDDHRPGPGGVCDACDRRYRAAVVAECSSCGTSGRGPAVEYAVVSPEARAFFGSTGRAPRRVGPWKYRLAAFERATETVVGTDPVAVDVEFALEGARRRVRVGAESDRR